PRPDRVVSSMLPSGHWCPAGTSSFSRLDINWTNFHQCSPSCFTIRFGNGNRLGSHSVMIWPLDFKLYAFLRQVSQSGLWNHGLAGGTTPARELGCKQPQAAPLRFRIGKSNYNHA